MSHEGSCHCGAITFTIEDDPVEASECNCSICRRTGALWAYLPAENGLIAVELFESVRWRECIAAFDARYRSCKRRVC